VQVWRGGLDWHAALLGGLIGLALVCRWRGVRFPAALDALALALPLGAALTYTGCLMVSCGHGREVTSLADYPWPIALELPDLYGVILPRLASQLYGVAWSLIVLGIAAILTRRIRRGGVSFWPVLGLIAAGAFAIGFTRGDAAPTVGALRLDQALDLAVIGVALLGTILYVSLGQPYRLYGPSGFVQRPTSSSDG
jgi:phosphatidylglycerol:prolipoprotein diacylglycerol transferase